MCAPPGPDGDAHPVILAACALCGVSEVYRDGRRPGDRRAGLRDRVGAAGRRDRRPGQRRTSRRPSARSSARWASTASRARASWSWSPTAGADAELLALDLLAQAEHGAGQPGRADLARPRAARRRRAAVERLAPERPTVTEAPLALVQSADATAPCALADAIAPEHLELVGARGRGAGRTACARAGCLFVGPRRRHGVRRLRRRLQPRAAHRRRRALPERASRRPPSGAGWLAYPCPARRAARLAPAGAALARAEGFPVHAESMERRA